MKTSREGLELIKRHEGFREEAYLCPAGIYTIGYGHTGNEVKEGCTITPEEGEILLMADLERYESVVNKFVSAPLTQSAFDALVSFSFNVGAGAFLGSTLFHLVNSDPHQREIADEFNKWVNARGRRLEGLVKRRAEECNLYFNEP